MQARNAADRAAASASMAADVAAGTVLAATCTYKDRALPGPDPLLLSLKLSRRFGSLEASLQGDNLLDRRWEELQGIPLPGRTFSAGLRWRQGGR